MGVLLCACGSGGDGDRPTAAQSRALHIPLATSGAVTAPGSSGRPPSPAAWAVVPLPSSGASGGVVWELATLAGDPARWSLVTPPGVSDAAGLVTSFSTSSGVAGVEASGLLGFSPAATTPAGGRHWAPHWEAGVFPGSLAPVPDAVAAGRRGQWMALFGATGTSLGEYTPGGQVALQRRSVLAGAAGRRCDLLALTAVGFGPGGVPVAGGRCGGAADVGLFELGGQGWYFAGTPLPATVTGVASAGSQAVSTPTGGSTDGSAGGAGGDDVSEVLGLAGSGRLVVLAEAVAADGTASVFRLTRDAAGAWTSSEPYDVPPSGRIVATGLDPDGASFLLLSSPGSLRAEVLDPSATRWDELPSPPRGTATLAFTGHDRAEALVTGPGLLSVYALVSGGRWSEVETIDLPVAAASPA